MDIIPLTLAISLLLSLTFIVLFVREFTRPRRAGAEHDSLLPLEPEHSVVAPPCGAVATSGQTHDHDEAHDHDHEHSPANPDGVCASKRTDGKSCSSCQRRKDRAEVRAEDGTKS